jgi:isocitrate dehydrogenase (NAD+)
MLRATAMLLSHIGKTTEAERLTRALDFCMFEDKRLVMTGRADGATCDEFAAYVAENL